MIRTDSVSCDRPIDGPLRADPPRAGFVVVTREAMAAALLLPGDAHITAGEYDASRGVFRLRVEHPDLFLPQEGQTLPEARPQYRREVITRTEVKFEGWR